MKKLTGMVGICLVHSNTPWRDASPNAGSEAAYPKPWYIASCTETDYEATYEHASQTGRLPSYRSPQSGLPGGFSDGSIAVFRWESTELDPRQLVHRLRPHTILDFRGRRLSRVRTASSPDQSEFAQLYRQASDRGPT